jgi:hypothetical protein
MLKKRQLLAGGFAAAAVLLGIGGAVAAAHPFGGAPAPQGPATIDEPVNGSDTPGVPDLPEPGDTPDGPGQ